MRVVCDEKLAVSELVTNFSSFLGTQRLIIMFKTVTLQPIPVLNTPVTHFSFLSPHRPWYFEVWGIHNRDEECVPLFHHSVCCGR